MTRSSARFDDLRAGRALAFPAPDEVLVAARHDEVPGVLARLGEHTNAGRWAFGFVAYEAGAGLDPSLPRVDPPPGTPLAWFGVTHAPETVAPVVVPEPWPQTGPWRPDMDAHAHGHGVRAVRERIAAGETYQANLTTTLRAAAPADPAAVYAAMATEQGGSYNAFLDLDDLVVASASPELFCEVDGAEVRMRPMKGTAARGPTTAADRAVCDRLRADPKERAENVMIVDLVRNDLGRVAVPGTVHVTDLCTPERYGTVWQLTSGVTAHLAPGTGWPELFGALFPCGSVTGAPKRRSMQILTGLEPGPRGVYCGAIGWVAPERRARFSVAIRTLVVDRRSGTASYGVGSGITWGSDPVAEHAELRAKARVLGHRTRPAGLLETFALVDGRPRHLERHLARMLDSAAYFGIPAEPAVLRSAVAEVTGEMTGEVTGDARVRVHLAADGRVEVTVAPLPVDGPGPVRLAVDDQRLDPDDVARHHKTTRRAPYDEARARHPGADDVVLVNDRGELVETTVATLAVHLDGVWCTPPLSAGALPGVGRAVHRDRGDLLERTLRPADLRRAAALAVVSSLRGWRRAVLVGDGAGPAPVAVVGSARRPA
ncbi:chorismate-binding protein [Actinomycetospora cinnamomea]|uniref:Para-aminobenzoate synthetase/4-amino-4-deoxychorismate lyase n=1 Tax=Actinomycetospora cinnamomea TaxID=663609 RepID=A0A2U1FMM5_9PSEU|nr:chorismate-binding protein [Actinomycetospora cinnamomea]PVZ13300.1 para-aminobenzoate synthetase/4-amino-4-deoxychorismate lyase [Actinomycetospora cinnamomea]